MPFLLDRTHHSDVKTESDIMLGGIIACLEDVWEHLWPPEPGVNTIGHAVIVDKEGNVKFDAMRVQLSNDMDNPKLLGEVFGKTLTSIRTTVNDFSFYKIGLKGDIPGGSQGSPASMTAGRYGTNSSGQYGWWPLTEDGGITPHPILRPPSDGGKHERTIDYDPPNAGDMIIGSDDDGGKWDKLPIGSGFLIYDPSDSKVKWGNLGTDPQDLVVWDGSAYILKNDQANPADDTFYGAIVSGGSVNIGWHTRTSSDTNCGGGGGSGDTRCCPVKLEVVRVIIDENTGIPYVTLELVFNTTIFVSGGGADSARVSGKYNHPATGEKLFNVQATSVTGTVIRFTIDLETATKNNQQTTITVTGVSDNIKCRTSDNREFSVAPMMNGNPSCHKSASVVIGNFTNTDPTGQPCNSHPRPISVRISVRAAREVSVSVTTDRNGFGYGELERINNNSLSRTLFRVEPPSQCTNNFAGSTNVPEGYFILGAYNEVCISVITWCCSTETTPGVSLDFCDRIFIDANGNGDTTFDLPTAPQEPPPPAPTGICDPKPGLLCLGITYNNGSIVARFEASRLVTGQSPGRITIRDQNGNAVADIEAITTVWSNQVASRNVIVFGRGVALENGKTYTICATAGPLACWDNQNIFSDPVGCCVAMEIKDGQGAGGPGQQPGGGGGPGGGAGGPNVPPNGGNIPVPNFDPGQPGTLTLSTGCTTLTLSASRRYVIFNAQGQHTIATCIPWTFEKPKSYTDLPDEAENDVDNAVFILTLESASVHKIPGGGVATSDVGGGATPIGQSSGSGVVVYANDEIMAAHMSFGSAIDNIGKNGLGQVFVPGAGPAPTFYESKTGAALFALNTWPDGTGAIVKELNEKPRMFNLYTTGDNHVIVGELGSLMTTQDINNAPPPNGYWPPWPIRMGPHNFARMRHIFTLALPVGMSWRDIWTHIRSKPGLGNWTTNITVKICLFYM